jgi:hypothetical protein
VGELGMHTQVWLESLKERENLQDLSIDWRIILSEIGLEGFYSSRVCYNGTIGRML